jgi:hypothetical protein
VPLLSDLLARLSFLAAAPAVLGVFMTATVLVVSQDWRLNVISLAVQYFLLSLLMTRLVRLEMAAVKALIGWLVCLVVYLTEQQARSLTRDSNGGSDLPVGSWFRARLEGWKTQGVSARAAFRFLAALTVALTAYTLASAIPLPQLPPGLAGACYLLGGLGVLLIGLSQDPVRVGLGLLTFLSAFDLFYVALEPSLVVAGLLGSISFVIALGMAYVRTAHVTGGGVEGAT